MTVSTAMSLAFRQFVAAVGASSWRLGSVQALSAMVAINAAARYRMTLSQKSTQPSTITLHVSPSCGGRRWSGVNETPVRWLDAEIQTLERSRAEQDHVAALGENDIVGRSFSFDVKEGRPGRALEDPSRYRRPLYLLFAAERYHDATVSVNVLHRRSDSRQSPLLGGNGRSPIHITVRRKRQDAGLATDFEVRSCTNAVLQGSGRNKKVCQLRGAFDQYQP